MAAYTMLSPELTCNMAGSLASSRKQIYPREPQPCPRSRDCLGGNKIASSRAAGSLPGSTSHTAAARHTCQLYEEAVGIRGVGCSGRLSASSPGAASARNYFPTNSGSVFIVGIHSHTSSTQTSQGRSKAESGLCG